MKRIQTVITVLFFIILPFSIASGQEKKNEQKVKIVIVDGSGTNVVIDTTFSGSGKIDSVIAKDGKVIYIAKKSPEWTDKNGNHVSVIARTDKDGTKSEHQYIYISDGDGNVDSGNDVIDVIVDNDVIDNETEKTRYVIAKKGITVSIEGTDEARIKELASEIEKKLENNNKDTKPVSKEGGDSKPVKK
jgi:hypothetical protein